MHLKNFNEYSTVPRSWCSAGRRHFFISSRGDVSRCAGFWYGHKSILGSIKDKDLRASIISDKNEYQACQKPMCVVDCDGYMVEHEILSSPPVVHRGGKLTENNFIGSDFCTLMLHLTALCNMKCPYCCAQGWMEAHKTQDLPLADWLDGVKFFTQTFSRGVAQVMGGEPTVKKGWEEIVLILIEAGWKVELITNMVKDKAVIDLVSSLSPEKRQMCLINISMHPTQKNFDPAKLMVAFFQLKVLKAHFACSLVQTPDNLRLAQEMNLRERVDNMGVPWFGAVPDYGFAKF